MRGVVCDCSRNGSQGVAEGSYVLFLGMTTLENGGYVHGVAVVAGQGLEEGYGLDSLCNHHLITLRIASLCSHPNKALSEAQSAFSTPIVGQTVEPQHNMRRVVCDCSQNGNQGIAEGSYVLFIGLTTSEKEDMSIELQV